jgi:hypothetical protein
MTSARKSASGTVCSRGCHSRRSDFFMAPALRKVSSSLPVYGIPEPGAHQSRVKGPPQLPLMGFRLAPVGEFLPVSVARRTRTSWPGPRGPGRN